MPQAARHKRSISARAIGATSRRGDSAGSGSDAGAYARADPGACDTAAAQ
ncbi:MAG TPA: hypothetical protein VFO18_16445 [Methylomirabilota bacterium]|nr:hypothetical protein [Methylomirabilota bacterium]